MVSTCSISAAGSSAISATATPLPEKCRLTSFSTPSSIELECVFFSVTPSEGNNSRISCEGTSSCRASSLMRILLIFGKNCSTFATQNLTRVLRVLYRIKFVFAACGNRLLAAG